MRVRDAIHGTIQFSDMEEKVLDSLPMQRLRGIRQLAMAYLVYPGANHTRFEHSIGTMHLAGKICKEIGLDEDRTSKVRIAALLHDVGHVAFSHESEEVLSAKLGSHEEIGKRIITKGELSDILSQNFSPAEIACLAEKPLGQIISSDIGADRMDYLLRDSHYTGVAYGVIDSDRVCSSLELSRKGILLTERGLAAAESLLVARFTMFSAVYLHKTVRIASRMLQESIRLAIEDETLEPCHAIGMSDAKMLETLCQSEKGREYAERLKKRRLYKKAFAIPLSKMKCSAKEAEEEISSKCGCNALIDLPRLSAETKIMLAREDGKIVPLYDQSELVSSLQRMQKSRLEAIVMCEEKYAEKVAAASKKVLG
ncbi:MAG: HD domain-containing protein [Candidatus Anstonellaceae archaeon]